MRAFALILALVVGCDVESVPAPTPKPPPATMGTATARKSCRDECEQTKIVSGGTDASLRACRARCDGQGAAAVSHELPRSISVAPAHHAPPAIRPR